MAPVAYDKELTALIVSTHITILFGGRQTRDRIRTVAEANDCVPHMLLNSAREAELHVFYALHHRYRPGDYESWSTLRVEFLEKAAWSRRDIRIGHVGGGIRSEFAPQPDDVVALEHWCSSGFANTDLDLQLKKHGIHQLVVIGLIAHVRGGNCSLCR